MRVGRVALVSAATATAFVAVGSVIASSEQSALTIECRFFHRSSVTKEVRTGPVVRLSDRRRAFTGRAGPFAFRATTGMEPGAEPRALSVRVWGRASRKQAASTLHQFGSERPLNQFAGGHGFTGLVYAYLPAGAELQFFCRAL